MMSCANKENTKPNIVLIMADDMGYECLSCNGSTEYNTPNIDQIAKEGIRFTHCISQPLCTPSRVKMMTGRYNYQNYRDFGYLDIAENTFANILKQGGYKTAIAGKWQLNGLETQRPGYNDLTRPHHFGFDEYCLWQVNKNRNAGERYADPLIYKNGEQLKATEGRYGPDLFSDFVTDFIENNHEKPFFVYYPMVLVHDPFEVTPLSKEWQNNTSKYKNDTCYFKDMVEYTDMIVGKIINKLQEKGIAENTIVMFTGDNGTHWTINTDTKEGEIQGGKGKLIDRGTRVPLVACWKGKGVKNEEYKELIEFSDFLPTIAEAGEAEIPNNIVGKSFLNLLKGEKQIPRKTVTVHYDHMRKHQTKKFMGRFVRTKEYKLYQDGRFYNVLDDSEELNVLNVEKLTTKEKNIKQNLQAIQDKAPIWPYNNETSISK